MCGLRLAVVPKQMGLVPAANSKQNYLYDIVDRKPRHW